MIIEDLTVEFGPGLNLLTGETGAGKSILVDALGLVAGARADRGAVRAGRERATVEALFEVDPGEPVCAWLSERGVAEPEDGQLLVRREVAVEGPGRVLVNGSPTTLALLRDLAGRLLELHRQHGQKSLLVAERHLELLDRYGGHAGEVAAVREAHAAVREARERLGELERQAGERAERVERLERTLREIDDLAPRPGEQAELERERRLLQHSERTVELLDRVVALSYEGEPAAASLAAQAASAAEGLAEIDPDLAELAGRMRSAAIDLEDAGCELRDYRDRADFDPARLDRIENRRVALERSCLAHGADEAGLLELRDRAAGELEALGSVDEALARAGQAGEQADQRYLRAAKALTRARKTSAAALEKAVGSQLADLALAKASLSVVLAPARGEPVAAPRRSPQPLNPRGAEGAELFIAANPGEPPRPLAQVASGGELSRIMLAIHVVSEDDQARRALVFDEIDAGVSGAVADAVGARLGQLAGAAQVLCVTHLPQVAAYADRHFSISKRVASGRTRAGIANLSGSERVEELARMLGGRKATAASRRHASELLSAAGRHPQQRPRSEA